MLVCCFFEIMYPLLFSRTGIRELLVILNYFIFVFDRIMFSLFGKKKDPTDEVMDILRCYLKGLDLYMPFLT